jgi:hypothetical protein
MSTILGSLVIALILYSAWLRFTSRSRPDV